MNKNQNQNNTVPFNLDRGLYWHTFEYNLPNNIISGDHIKKSVELFNVNVLDKFNDDDYLLISFRVKLVQDYIEVFLQIKEFVKKIKIYFMKSFPNSGLLNLKIIVKMKLVASYSVLK
uniref:hypothetical protein n=1 Tax=Daedaleopsis nitida TaxID=1140402 RepID=UPI0030E00853